MKKVVIDKENKKEEIKEEVKVKQAKKFNVNFGKDLSEAISLKKDKHLLNMSFIGRKKNFKKTLKTKGIIKEDKVTYKDFEEGLDLDYEVKDNKIKESIIINKLQETYEFEFKIDIGDLTPSFNEKENTLELKENNKVIYKILSPYMEDSIKARSNDCTYEIEQVDNNLTLVLKCDSSWINDNKRVLPIIIDPTIEVVNEDVITIEQYKNNSLISLENEKRYKIGKSTSTEKDSYSLKVTLDVDAIKQSNYSRGLYLMFECINTVKKSSTINLVNNGIISTSLIRSTGKKIFIDLLPVVKQNINSFYIEYVDDASGCLILYSFNNEEKYKPTLVFNNFIYDSTHLRRGNYKEYEIDRSGVLKVNLYNQNYFLHEHYDATISENVLSIDLNHIYDFRDTKDYYLGNKVRTNLHQYLIKGEDYNKLLGSKDITYVDGQGVSHDLYEKWYYLDEDKKKRYVEKEKVYLDSDQEIKYCDNENNIYEVFYECKNDDGLKYISSSSLMNYHKTERVIIKGDLYLEIANTKIKLERVDKSIKVPHFYIPEKDQKIIEFIDKNKVYLKKQQFFDDEGNLLSVMYFDSSINFYPDHLELRAYKKAENLTNALGGTYWLSINSFVVDKIELRQNNVFSYENDVLDIYINEDLNQVIQQIETIDNQFNDFDSNRALLERQRKHIANNRKVFLDSLDIDNATYDEKEAYQRTLEEYDISLQSITNQLDALLINYQHYIMQKELLLKKKQKLIEEQIKQVNDLIIDKEGNTLGFDGYGRLILIQDKCENKINIEYGYEEENKDRIIKVSSSTQSIKFNYNKETGLLESILDPRGRITKYKYNADKDLTAIIYNDNTKTVITRDSNNYEIVSPNLRKLKWERKENNYRYESFTILKHVYDGVISSSKISNASIDRLTVKDYYDVDTYPDYTKITDIKGKQEIYYFDEQIRVIEHIKDNEVEVINYQFDNVLNAARYKKGYIKQTLNNCAVDTLYTFNYTSNKLLGLDLRGFNDEDFYSLNIEVTITFNDNKTKTINQNQYDLCMQAIIVPLFNNNKTITKVQFKLTSLRGEIYPMTVNLIELEEATTYTYDSFKRLIKKQDQDKEITYSDFNDNDIPLTIKEVDNYNNEVTTHYSYNENNLLTYVEDSKLNVTEYFYDELGNCIEERSYNKKDASLVRVNKVSYDEQGRPLSTQGPIKDKEGKYPSKEITYLPGTNIESKIKGFNNEVTTYSYDYNNGELLSISSSSNGVNNSTTFTYNYGLLTSMSHHGVKVGYVYDGLGRKTMVTLNGSRYLSYEYNDDIEDEDLEIQQGSSIKTTYKNNYFVENIYNEKELLRCQKLNNKDTITYEYDEDDNLIKTEYSDDTPNEEITYLDNKISLIKKGDYEKNYTYDVKDRVKTLIEKIGDEEISHQNYSFVESKIRMTITEKNSFNYIYFKDVLNRITHEEVTKSKVNVCQQYSYLQQEENSLDLISKVFTEIRVTDANNSTSFLTEVTNYEYDVNGNIVSIDTDDDITRYKYDSLNRLIREDNPKLDQTVVYKYDEGGNIISKKVYPYTLDDKLKTQKVYEYAYNCNGNNDQLISYNGQLISYDTMGRPTTYKGTNYTWDEGSHLIGIGDNITYTYNLNGIRTKKVVNGKETSFLLDGNRIVKITIENNEIIFRYALNKLKGFMYNDIEFIYERNIQGDIIRIYNSSTGKIVGEYAYDGYGNQLVIKNVDNIATINPFRYRGYYYDEETNLYYLNSRYYDPETGRFISPDTLSILDETRGQINGLNLYMYCGDNPVMRVDPSGKFFFELFAIISIVAATIYAIDQTIRMQSYIDNNYSGWEHFGLTIANWTLGYGFTSLITFDANKIVDSSEKNNFIIIDFKKNKNYNIITSILYAIELNKRGLPDGRTIEGVWFELISHHIANVYTFGFVKSPREADMGSIYRNEGYDYNAWFFESVMKAFKKGVLFL